MFLPTCGIFALTILFLWQSKLLNRWPFAPYINSSYFCHQPRRCRRKKGPWPWTCKPEKHDYEVCQYEMYKYRKALKEYLVKTGEWNKGQFPEIEPHQK